MTTQPCNVQHGKRERIATILWMSTLIAVSIYNATMFFLRAIIWAALPVLSIISLICILIEVYLVFSVLIRIPRLFK